MYYATQLVPDEVAVIQVSKKRLAYKEMYKI